MITSTWRPHRPATGRRLNDMPKYAGRVVVFQRDIRLCGFEPPCDLSICQLVARHGLPDHLAVIVDSVDAPAAKYRESCLASASR